MMTVKCTAKEGGIIKGTASVNVWVHQALDRVWLTPARLTVRQGAKNVRFSVLARFTDVDPVGNVSHGIADLSNWSLLETSATLERSFVRYLHGPSGTDINPAMQWTVTSGGGMSVDFTRGYLTCPSAFANVIVEASVLRASGNIIASGNAVGAKPWSTRVLLTPLSGADFNLMNNRRNVLILPDGFDSSPSSKTEFEALARQAVDRLARRAATRPYDLLKDHFNFFMAWVESPELDISVLNELVPQLFALGQPVLGIPHGKQSNPRILDRFLTNERDTAFHIALGARPTADFDTEQHYPGFHELRLHPDDWDAFLRGLSQKPNDPDHHPEGEFWARGGKDEALRVFFCRTAANGAVNIPTSETARTVFMTLEQRDVHQVAANAAGDGYDLVVAALDPDKAQMTCWATLAHELAHSFRLADEYGDNAVARATNKDKCESAGGTWSGHTCLKTHVGKQRFVDASANTQRRRLCLE